MWLLHVCICEGETTQRGQQLKRCFPIGTFSVLSSFPTLLLGKSWATLVFYFIRSFCWGTKSRLLCLSGDDCHLLCSEIPFMLSISTYSYMNLG